MNTTTFTSHDIGYLLTAYADGQLAPDGVMWVEEQLDRNPDLRVKLKEIRHLQAGLRAAFAGGAPEFSLDLPRREALLKAAARGPRKFPSNIISFKTAFRVAVAASFVVLIAAVTFPVIAERREKSAGYAAHEVVDLEMPPMRVTTMDVPADPFSAPAPTENLALRGPVTTETDSEFEASKGREEARSEFESVTNSTREAFTRTERPRQLPPPKTPNAVSSLSPTTTASAERKSDLAARQQHGQSSHRFYNEPQTDDARADYYSQLKQNNDQGVNRNKAPPSSGSGASFGGRSAANKEVPQPSKPSLDPVVAQVPGNSFAAPMTTPPAPKPQSPPELAEYVGVVPSPPPIVVAGKNERFKEDNKFAEGKALSQTQALEPDAPVRDEKKLKDVASFADPSAREAENSDKLNDSKQVLEKNAQQLAGFQDKVVSESEKLVRSGELTMSKSDNAWVGTDGAALAMNAKEKDRREAGKKGFPSQFDKQQPSSPSGEFTSTLNRYTAEDAARLTLDGDKRNALDNVKASGTTKSDLLGDNGIVLERSREAQLAAPAAVLRERYPRVYSEIADDDDVKDKVSGQHAHAGEEIAHGGVGYWARHAAQVDPQQSLAMLRTVANHAGWTGDGATLLRMMGSDKLSLHITPAALNNLNQSLALSLQNEPVARGVLRVARAANLQARFSGGRVDLDVAQRPLDPTDDVGFDLPTFRDLFGTSPMQAIASDPIQTVAIDADTASFQYAKARVAAGQPIDAATIKPEHFINAMPMDYPPAHGPEAFSLYAEAAPSPFAHHNTAWGARTALVTIGAVAKPAAADERRPLSLTLALDCSGSMAQPGGLDRIKSGLVTLISNLRAEDRVSIVAFGDQARVVLPATPGNEPQQLLNAIDTLATGGATNAAEGLTLAYQLAAETAKPGVESRVLLATDGGTVAGAEDLLRRVTAFKDRGITLVVVGCGQTYHAGPLQELATKGDGQHFYVGSHEEAQTLFGTSLMPDNLAVLAKDAKLQVTWNPQRISHARLIGYDQRRLAAKDFRDNSVDAGELSQDTQVTALFEVLLVDGGTGPLGNAAVRYYDTRRQSVRELACPLPGSILASQASDRLRLVACAAATAEWLQRGWWSNVHLISPQEIDEQLQRCPQPIAADLRRMLSGGQ